MSEHKRLILTRWVGEEIYIGPDPARPQIRIVIDHISGGRVKVSCYADESVRILRQEVAEKLLQQSPTQAPTHLVGTLRLPRRFAAKKGPIFAGRDR